MSPSEETTIRVPVSLRDQIRSGAVERRLKQADFISLALRELEQAEFLRSVAAIEWDDEAVRESQEWDEANLDSAMDPWEPTP
ncbi:MAG: hypothetical protein FWF25_06685 [Propionibacteriaceae bacterium]|nr:hypothetical protein [Propionibacteriaceae bacterium]